MRWAAVLSALVPRPRLHLIRFHGVLAPNAKLRAAVAPGPAQNTRVPSDEQAHGAPARMGWARLLERVFDLDLEHCPQCGGNFKIIAAIEEPAVIVKILTHLGLPANEGDLFGGSRGFTVFDAKTGAPKIDAGNTFEYLAVRAGHYPENRSQNRGSETEGLTVGEYGHKTFAFVGSERGNFVAVYRSIGNQLYFKRLLATGSGPEGLLAIPGRNLFVVTNENDEDVRAQIGIYRLENGAPSYPQIQSIVQQDGKPIGWGALSALDADRILPTRLDSVQDSFYEESAYFTISTLFTPARIIEKTVHMKDGATVNYDLEGIAQRSDGSFWAASEGAGNAPSPTRLNLPVQFAADGTVMREGRPATSRLWRSTASSPPGLSV
jgi:hypothetical protein